MFSILFKTKSTVVPNISRVPIINVYHLESIVIGRLTAWMDLMRGSVSVTMTRNSSVETSSASTRSTAATWRVIVTTIQMKLDVVSYLLLVLLCVYIIDFVFIDMFNGVFLSGGQ